jgi:hypothetical protein
MSIRENIAEYRDHRGAGCTRVAALRYVADWRGRLGWRLSDASHGLARLGNRLCEDIPCDYHLEWEDGRAYGERVAGREPLTYERMAEILQTVGADPEETEAILAWFEASSAAGGAL